MATEPTPWPHTSSVRTWPGWNSPAQHPFVVAWIRPAAGPRTQPVPGSFPSVADSPPVPVSRCPSSQTWLALCARRDCDEFQHIWCRGIRPSSMTPSGDLQERRRRSRGILSSWFYSLWSLPGIIVLLLLGWLWIRPVVIDTLDSGIRLFLVIMLKDSSKAGSSWIVT